MDEVLWPLVNNECLENIFPQTKKNVKIFKRKKSTKKISLIACVYSCACFVYEPFEKLLIVENRIDFGTRNE